MDQKTRVEETPMNAMLETEWHTCEGYVCSGKICLQRNFLGHTLVIKEEPPFLGGSGREDYNHSLWFESIDDNYAGLSFSVEGAERELEEKAKALDDLWKRKQAWQGPERRRLLRANATMEPPISTPPAEPEPLDPILPE